jgi:cell division protein FtsW (lipid II flippase)
MIALARRRTELGLLILAVLITGGLYTLVSLGRNAKIPANIGPFLAVIFGLFFIAHLAVRRFAKGADGILLPCAALLNGIGYVFIARIDEAKNRPAGLAGLQAGWTALGVAAFIVTLIVVRKARDLQRYRYTFLLLALIAIMMPLVPGIGRTINGARIWIYIGPASLQPGEFAKIVLAIFFASYLVEKRELLGMATFPKFRPMLPDLKHLGPVLLAWGFTLVVLIAEKDLGSALLFFALFILLVYVATGRAAYTVVGFGMFLAGAALAYKAESHVRLRFDTWLNPWKKPDSDGFQIIQGTFALSSGGFTGTGPGLGRPESIPIAETDFIFAAIGEELGLLGTTAVILCFLLMVGCGLRIASRAKGQFEKLLATGLTILLGVQSFIIIGGVTRVLPLTGLALPFVSYGGSSLLANYILLALLLRISDDEAQRAGEVEPRKPRVRDPEPEPAPVPQVALGEGDEARTVMVGGSGGDDGERTVIV